MLMLAAGAATRRWLGPAPPSTVTMSTGTAGSDFDLFGQRYQRIFKRSGVELRLLPSAGGTENLRRLNDPRSGVAVSFAEGGLTSEAQSPALESLGTLAYQPFWAFCRCTDAGPRLEALHGKRIAIGTEGGGTRAFALKLLALNGIDTASVQLMPVADEPAGAALLRGDIDAAVMLASWDTPVVRRLLASTEITALSFPRVDAYVALYPFLTKLTVPAGVGNLAANRPAAEVKLMAPKASLIVRRDLHPAIQYLLLEAAAEIHAAPNIFHRAGQFPAMERDDLPLAKVAREYAKSGVPFLQRYLPFGVAVQATRLLLLLIPVLGIAYPLLSVLPRIYLWLLWRRIFSLYGELKLIEIELEAPGGSADTLALLEQLDRLERRANRLRLSPSFADRQYHLRSHIALVRARLLHAAAPRAAAQSQT
jgi:TRAP-type uncharacterized transport system substrate-binding protein